MKINFGFGSQAAKKRRELILPFLFLMMVLSVSVALDQWLKLTASRVVVNNNFAWSISLVVSPLWISIFFYVGSMILAATHFVYGQRRYLLAVCYGLLLGAGTSNLIDRLLIGGVKDIWPIPIMGGYNNLADWLLLVAVLGIISILISEVIAHEAPPNVEFPDQ